MFSHLKIYSKQEIQSLTKVRVGETKLGEVIDTLNIERIEGWESLLKESSAKFVLLGLPEDIGVRANLGRAGTESAWEVALPAILNLQSNDFIQGNSLLVWGHVDFSDLMQFARQTSDLSTLRTLTEKIDERICPIIKDIVKADKIPVIIGGGHNNSYPILKAVAEGLYENNKIKKAAVNCINCDAHTDLRPVEGRHSGNGFAYALEKNHLDKYYVVGPHQLYITNSMMKLFKSNKALGYTTFEDFAINDKISFQEVLDKAIAHTKENYCGIELDMDCIENLPSSAQTATGISANMARQFINHVSSNVRPAYLHITEAAPSLGNKDQAFVIGKLIASLVTDFIKAVNV